MAFYNACVPYMYSLIRLSLSLSLWLFMSCMQVVIADESGAPEEEYRNDAVYELVTLNWPPYVFIKDGQIAGYDVDVAKAAFNAVDVDPPIELNISVLPWKRAVLSSELGRYVALFPEYYDKSRSVKFTFSEGYPGSQLYFFKLKSRDFVLPEKWQANKNEDFKLLNNMSIGVVRGYVNTPEIDAGKNFKKIEVATDKDLLELLYKKRVDLVVMDHKVMQQIQAKHSPKYDGIVKLPNLLGQKKHHLGFSKAHYLSKQALSDFNKGLNIIRTNGTLKTLMKKYNIN